MVRQLIPSSALLLVCLVPHRAIAQSTTSLLPDASVLPSRGVRFRVLTAWTRYDELLGDGGRRNIGSTLAVDSLGVAQVPAWAPIETSIRAASGVSNFRLNAGAILSPANSRIVTAPLVIEYGLTSRITLGVVVPLVETRTTLVARLNPLVPGGASLANVGPNPATTFGSAIALGQNGRVVDSLRFGATTLSGKLGACTTDPSGSGCAGLLAQRSAIETLVGSSNALATVLENLYGTAKHTDGQSYVPLDGTAVQTAINQQIKNTAAQLTSFLGTTVNVGTGMFGAQGPGAQKALTALFQGVGRDTLQSTDRSSVGDISFGATLNLLNSFGDTTGTSFYHPQYRLSVNGTFRLGTGQPSNTNRAFDVATGYGQNGIEGGVAADLRFGNHLSGSAIGSYTAQLGTIDVLRVPGAGNAIYPLDLPFRGTYSAGNVTQITVIPRIRLAGYFALTGQYSLVRAEADKYAITLAPSDTTVAPPSPFGLASSMAQQIGFGFTYSTIVGPDRAPGAIPFEVSYNHLETLAGSGGPVYKTFRDRVELKVYLPTGRRR